MLFLLVKLHGDQAARGEAAAGNVAVVRRLAAVSFQVFVQVRHALTPGSTHQMCEY